MYNCFTNNANTSIQIAKTLKHCNKLSLLQGTYINDLFYEWYCQVFMTGLDAELRLCLCFVILKEFSLFDISFVVTLTWFVIENAIKNIFCRYSQFITRYFAWNILFLNSSGWLTLCKPQSMSRRETRNISRIRKTRSLCLQIVHYIVFNGCITRCSCIYMGYFYNIFQILLTQSAVSVKIKVSILQRQNCMIF